MGLEAFTGAGTLTEIGLLETGSFFSVNAFELEFGAGFALKPG